MEVYVWEVRQVIAKLLSLTKKESIESDEACEDEN